MCPPIRWAPSAKSDHDDGRGQGEGQERCDGLGESGTVEAQRKSDLAGSWAGQELAQGHGIGVALIGDPAAALYQLGVKVSQVGDRSAE